MKVGKFIFGSINYSWAGIIVLFICFSVLSMIFWKKRVAAQLVNASWSRAVLKHFSLVKIVIKSALFMGAVGLIFFALLRPQWGLQEQRAVQHGRDLFIALDISRSMLAQDFVPDRLTYAKEKIRRLVKKLSCERVGLILFSGSAFVQCPLTADYGAFYLFLEQVDTETISSGTTALDQAIVESIRAFNNVSQRQNKLVIFFTDGEDFSSNLTHVRKEARAQKMILFTVGVGSKDGAPIPIINRDGSAAGHQKDQQGRIVISKLQESMLQQIADESGGMYVRATRDDQDIEHIVKRVSAIEKERIDEKVISGLQDRYYYFTLSAFILFILEWLL